jgi:hypothetical protein
MLFEVTIRPDDFFCTKPGCRVTCFTSMRIIRPSRPARVRASAEKNGTLFVSGCHLSPRDVHAAYYTNVSPQWPMNRWRTEYPSQHFTYICEGESVNGSQMDIKRPIALPMRRNPHLHKLFVISETSATQL